MFVCFGSNWPGPVWPWRTQKAGLKPSYLHMCTKYMQNNLSFTRKNLAKQGE